MPLDPSDLLVTIDSTTHELAPIAKVTAANLVDLMATNTETVAGASMAKAATPGGLKAAVYDVEPINVGRYGLTKANVIAALNAAEARGVGTPVYFPPGIYDVGTGLSLSGYSCQIQGAGAAGDITTPKGTTFYASTQTGPVLDFTGWVYPVNDLGRVRHGGFRVVGSGVADATKARSGVRLSLMVSASFHDIVVQNTGGAAWEHVGTNNVYLCDFERIVLGTPVSAAANDVPYMRMVGSNGNRFRGIGFRSVLATADTGVSGALIIENDTNWAPEQNLFDGCWFEYLHLSTGGCLISTKGNSMEHRGWQLFDCSKIVGQTGTAFFRFLPVTATGVPDFGGNIVSGFIPGKTAGTNAIDMGVDLRQSRNSIRGVKGYLGTNVVIAAGVTNSDIELSGAQSGATDPAVIDNSGNTTNRYVDHYLRTERSTTTTVYATPGTYTHWTARPASLLGVDIYLVGGGSAGSSGRRGAAGTVRGGGGGGSPGGVAEGFFAANAMPSGSFAFTIPAVAAGGAAVTVNDTNGNAGAVAAAVVVGPLTVEPSAVSPGGGTTVGGAAAEAQSTMWGTLQVSGGAGGAGAATPTAPYQGWTGGTGGGGGAGISTVEAVFAGAAGGGAATRTGYVHSAPASGAAGASGGNNGGAGVLPAVNTERYPGTGGGGGGSHATGAGGAGGAGARGSGGGGGAGSTNGANSGAGGAGGSAFVVITEYHVV